MIIICPKCSTKYNLEDDKVRPLSKAKCTFCGHIFVLADGLDHKDFNKLSLDDQKNLKNELSAESETNAESNASPKKKKTKKLLLIGLIFLLLLGGISYFGFSKFIKTESNSTSLQNGSSLNSPGNPNATSEIPSANVKDIEIRVDRQFFVNNEKVGKLFVIEGQAVNNFKTPKELIKIEAKLLDENASVLVSKEQFCGVTLSQFQLQALSEEDLNNAINNNIEILTNNTNIPSGGTVPFMVVFSNTPSTVREFVLKVTDVKDPSQK